MRAVTTLLLAVSLCSGTAQGAERFSFGVMGDTPYNAVEERDLEWLLEDLAREPLAFVIHVGDIKGGSSPCSLALLQQRRALLDRSPVPLVLLPGDNEWTDCHRSGADPLVELRNWRQVFAADSTSLGSRRISLERQGADGRFDEYRENVRWRHGGVLFSSLHVVGSHDNAGRNAAMDVEHHARTEANAAWMQETFALAARDDVRAVVLALHANPRFDQPGYGRGYGAIMARLEAAVAALGKPVLLVHGDTHMYRVDRPLAQRDPALRNLVRVEVFGSPRVSWVRVTVDPDASDPFEVQPGPP